MSPILVRPVREQLEHDRIIRLIQSRSRRRYEVGVNPGIERNAAVGGGALATYPDVVLMTPDRGRRVEAIVEVETGESVNHLEALSQWREFSKLRPAFHLYVPAGMVDVARRLCEDNQIVVNEIWSYHSVGEDVRFTMVHRTRDAAPATPRRPVRPPAARAKRLVARPTRQQRAARVAGRGKARRSQKRK